uniref:Uncharacterized protein n=1 Tax=Cacopsylla melanoneura TaxID=428564 RepID=A0A8D8Q2X1_9HEMI
MMVDNANDKTHCSIGPLPFTSHIVYSKNNTHSLCGIMWIYFRYLANLHVHNLLYLQSLHRSKLNCSKNEISFQICQSFPEFCNKNNNKKLTGIVSVSLGN